MAATVPSPPRRRPPPPRRHAGNPTRLLLPTGNADLRVTWHADEDRFVLSMWHGATCVGTAPLTPAEAATMTSFLATRLGER